MMTPDIFTLCDFAQDNKGKLTIVGTFNAINLESFPGIAPDMNLVIRMRFSDVDSKKHHFKVQIIEDDTKENVIKPLVTVVDASSVKDDFYDSNMIIKFNMVLFKAPGNYHIELNIDDNVFLSPFIVRKK